MQPFLLATGETRALAPLTDELSPAMVPIGHQPVMAHLVELLAAQGWRRLVVSLHYLPASIEAYFGLGERWGVMLEYVIQRDAVGTAGALKRASRLLNETILVMPADKLIDLNVAAALDRHRRNGYAATILVPAPGLEGSVQLPHGRGEAVSVSQPVAPADVSDRLGIYLLEPAVLTHIPLAGPFDIHRQLIPALLAAGLPVGTHTVAGYANALATYADYFAAQRKFMTSLDDEQRLSSGPAFPNRASVRGRHIQPGIWVGRNNAIHPTARLAAPVFIGANCRIGRDVELGQNVVLGANVIIDDEATVSESIVLDNTYVGKLVKLDQRLAYKNLLIDLVTGTPVRVADAFWLSETHTAVDQSLAWRLGDQLMALLLGVCAVPLAAVWAVSLWLAAGRVFSRQRYLRSTKAASPGRPASTESTMTVLNFYSGQRNAVAAWLSRWQARLELERLPELLSVIRGDLRLVGVKPLTPAEAGHVTEAWQLAQREFEPGFTGLWYVQTGRESDLDAALVADIYYAATRHWRGDIQILLQTPAAWLRHVRSAAGAEHKQVERSR